MKVCGACSRQLPRENFSKKQWQSKQNRRCKDCIAANREVNVDASNDIEPLPCGDEKLASDEDLFKEPPPREDECPICFLPRPIDNVESQYQACCGKHICNGCVYAVKMAGDERGLCPFCRTPPPTSDREIIERLKERAGGDDAVAIYNLGVIYYHGTYGMRRNIRKANTLFLQAGELGDARGYNSIGHAYYNGRGVEGDENKSKYYWELAAMGGEPEARHNLGSLENNAGNITRAVKHWMISAAAGYDDSLKEIREGFLNVDVTKDDFEKALRAHQASKDEMKSEQREAAARFYG